MKEYGRTAIWIASSNGNESISQSLLKAGADIFKAASVSVFFKIELLNFCD